MKKGIILAVTILLVGTFSIGCPKTVVVREGPEILFPGEFVESVDAQIDLIKCRGKGVDRDAAILHARKGCLEWMVNERMAQTPGERRAYMAAQKDVMAKVDSYIPPMKPGPASGNGPGVKSRTRNNDGTVNIEINIKVYSDNLRKDLVAMNIIQSKDEMLDSVGRPTILATPFKASKGNKNRGHVERLIGSYLTEAKWEVVSLGGVQDLDKMVDAIGEVAEAEEDEAAKIAMAAGADVYILFEVSKRKGKGMAGGQIAYTVSLEARETTAQKVLANRKVTTPAYYENQAAQADRVLEEGIRDAMAKVMPQVSNYWNEDAPKGRRFYVVFKNAPKKTDMKMNSVFKKACSRVKLIRSTASEAVFQVQCKMDNLELASAIDEGIEAKMSGTEYDFAAKNRSSIIVVFK